MKLIRPGVDRIADLELFVRTVERGSLTAAGVSLGLTTPLVSRGLARLEAALGVRLIDRTSRMVVLTSHGREFHARAESVLRLVREAEGAMRMQADELHGTLRVSLPTSAVEIALIASFVELFQRQPDFSIEVHLSDRPVDVIARGLDAALYLTDAPDRHPGDVILGRHPTSLAAAPGYLDRAGRPTEPEELLHHRTVRAVSARGRPSDWALTHEDGREIVLPPGGAMFLSDELRVLSTAIMCGAGIGRMPVGYVVQSELAGELESVLPQWRFRPMMIALTVRQQGARSAKVTALIELALSTLERIDALAIGRPPEALYAKREAPAS